METFEFDFSAERDNLEDLDCGKSLLVKDRAGDIYKITKRVDENGPRNPRDEYGLLGTMVCWSGEYLLGDEQPEFEPTAWLSDLLFYETSGAPYYGTPVYEYLKNCCNYAKIIENDTEHTLVLLTRKELDNDWDMVTDAPYVIKDGAIDYSKVPDWFLQECIEALMYDECIKILESIGFYFLPLYLHDGNVLSISTERFDDVAYRHLGWIYTSKEAAVNEMQWNGIPNDESIYEALRNEVVEYDKYLSGEAYCIFIDEFDPNSDVVEEDPGVLCSGFTTADDMADYIQHIIGEFITLEAEQ